MCGFLLFSVAAFACASDCACAVSGCMYGFGVLPSSLCLLLQSAAKRGCNSLIHYHCALFTTDMVIAVMRRMIAIFVILV